ncbi:hypothetical protein B0T17DRAFT_181882 [Bombardia bombarda]|uniref:Uncharacterized protein n=1 Tax=Bombardia bombarda TaxID=252184 RepID=A0AA39X8F9_9PEZI|nr:hypothetical protein B0T17DRAFT_181882 [Bombardia bombarda]
MANTAAPPQLAWLTDNKDAIVGPWEVVEFVKLLSNVPPVMDGSAYRETEEVVSKNIGRRKYIETIRGLEEERGLDGKLSGALADEEMQNLARAFWLYLGGRVGFYDRVLKQLESRLDGDHV